MGGCSPSKMPSAAQTETDRGSSKFGFSSSFRNSKNHHPNASSSNISDLRIKSLASSDPTYEVVKGGKKALAPETTSFTPTQIGLHEHRDVESQTAQTLPVNPRPEIKLSRPSGFGLSSRSQSARSQAPLATMETASELGTPTPMEENKSLSRSFLPTPNRLVFSPRSPLEQKTPTHASMPSIRPSEPPPKPPSSASRVIQPPSSLGGQGRNGTDNVMISTSTVAIKAPTVSQSAVSGLPKPGTLGSSSRQKNKEVDNSRSFNSISNKPLTEPTLLKAFNDRTLSKQQSDPACPAPTVLPVIKIPASKGLRTPSSVGTAPRGPLAEQSQHRVLHPALSPPSHNPLKPPRKSPQPSARTPLVFERQTSSEDVGAREELALDTEALQSGSMGGSSRLTFDSNKHAFANGLQHADENGFSDDGEEISRGIPKDREAMAERDMEYSVDEGFIKTVLSGLAEAKNLAQALLDIGEKSSQLLKNETKISRNTSIEKSTPNGPSINLMEILTPPSNELLKDHDACRDLILRLQAAVHMLTLEKKS